MREGRCGSPSLQLWRVDGFPHCRDGRYRSVQACVKEEDVLERDRHAAQDDGSERALQGL
jgi:hypothetical protein